MQRKIWIAVIFIFLCMGMVFSSVMVENAAAGTYSFHDGIYGMNKLQIITDPASQTGVLRFNNLPISTSKTPSSINSFLININYQGSGQTQRIIGPNVAPPGGIRTIYISGEGQILPDSSGYLITIQVDYSYWDNALCMYRSDTVYHTIPAISVTDNMWNRVPNMAISSPAFGTNVVKGTNAYLSWIGSDPDTGDSITEYNLRIGTSAGASDLGSYSRLSTSYALNTSSIAGPYPRTIYWGVRAKDSNNAWSNWTESSFNVTASSVATLSSLVLSSGSLCSGFAPTTYSYSANVPYNINSITVTPTLTDSTASIKVNVHNVNSGSPSPAIPLAVGNNTINVVVTAQDRTTTRNYSITVNRAANNVPVVTLSPDINNIAFSEVTGYNQVTISGNVIDADNDDVIVYLRVKKDSDIIFSQDKSISQCGGIGKSFSFQCTVDNLKPEGTYTIDLWANDGK